MISLPCRKFRVNSIAELVKWYNTSHLIGEIENKVFSIDSVILEKQQVGIIPDIIANIRGHKFFIEIAVTSFLDSEKQKKIEKIGIPVLEVNLSKVERNETRGRLKQILIGTNSNLKTWKYNPKDEAISNYLKECSSEFIKKLFLNIQAKNITGYKNNPRVQNCPAKYDFFTPPYGYIRKTYSEIMNGDRIYNDVPIDRCLDCEFLYRHFEEERYIKCLANEYILQKSMFKELNKEIEMANKKGSSVSMAKFKLSDYV